MAKPKGIIKRPTEEAALSRVMRWTGRGYQVDMVALRQINPKLADRIERVEKEK
jgi:hypothetical protein